MVCAELGGNLGPPVVAFASISCMTRAFERVRVAAEPPPSSLIFFCNFFQKPPDDERRKTNLFFFFLSCPRLPFSLSRLSLASFFATWTDRAQKKSGVGRLRYSLVQRNKRACSACFV